MHVDGGGHAIFAQRFADHRADGEIRHVVVVHHVEVHPIGARREDFRSVFTEPREISGKDARGDDRRWRIGAHILGSLAF